MILRFVEDRRTLLWALVFFPALPALIYASPALALPLAPLMLYLSYCSGVLSHNHSHSPVFRKRAHNHVYSAWLSLFYGCPIFVWVPTHHRDHHVHVDGDRDRTSTRRHSANNTLRSALTYPFRSAAWQWPAVREYVANAKLRHPHRYRRLLAQTAALCAGHAALFALALALHGPLLGAFAYAAAFGLPALIAPWLMMFTNYLQHVDCDARAAGAHSRNFTQPLLNWLIFDNGFHTVHHDQPSLHWSRLKARHHERVTDIDPRCNERSLLSYCLKTYAGRGVRRSSAGAL
jgi:beta-carotene hydroxylase